MQMYFIIGCLLVVVFIQLLMLYLLYIPLKFSTLQSKSYKEYQQKRDTSLAEYRKCVEEWQGLIARQKESEKKRMEWEEQYQREIEEDAKKWQKEHAQYEDKVAEYDKQKKEWDSVLERLEAFIEKWEQRE